MQVSNGIEYLQYGSADPYVTLVPQSITVEAVPAGPEPSPDESEFLTDVQSMAFKVIGAAAATCYAASEEFDKCKARMLRCVRSGHHSVLEHFNLTLRIVCDRGTSHALVRHRHIAVTQGSTIYHKEKDGISICALPAKDPYTGEVCGITGQEMYLYNNIAALYIMNTTKERFTAGRARDILPTSLATTVVITTNLREWFYIQRRRTGPGDAIRMHVFAKQLDNVLKELFPDIHKEMGFWYSQHPI